jgi:hypothetical protein
MSGHTLVRSRFEIHPSCALWISSFLQVHGSHPHSPGTQRDPIGTPSEPEKDTDFHLFPTPQTTHNHFASRPLCPSPPKPPASKHFFPNTFHNPQRPRSLLRGFSQRGFAATRTRTTTETRRHRGRRGMSATSNSSPRASRLFGIPRGPSLLTKPKDSNFIVIFMFVL